MNRVARSLAVVAFVCVALQGGLRAQTSVIQAGREYASPAAMATAKLVQTVAASVIALDAKGSRTFDAIADSDVKLTLADLPDGSALSVLCLNGGAPLKSFTQAVVQQLGIQGKALRPACSGTGQGSDPFVFAFHLHREGGISGVFSETPMLLTADLEKDGTLDNDDDEAIPDKPEPKPILLNTPRTQNSHTAMLLPQGCTPVRLPEPIHSDSAFASFDQNVTFSDGELVTDQKFVIKKDKVDIIELPAYSKWHDEVQIEQANPTLRLTLSIYYPPSTFETHTDNQKQAAEFIKAARSYIKSKDFAKAETALDQAEAADPGHELLHDCRGSLAAAQGNNAAALVEYTKELQAFPQVLFEKASIAQAQRKLGDKNGAIATLQRWMVEDPNAAYPATELMHLYHGLGRDDLAVLTGDQAMNILTPDAKRTTELLMIYGREQMLVGQAQSAKATFDRLLDLTIDIEFVNDAAYLLSEKGLSLDKGEQAVRDSLEQFDPDHLEDVPHIYPMDDKARTNLLFETWDTLGWILFNKGQVADAEAYIRAAWINKQDIAISRHLGQILAGQGKPVEALDIYKLGLAAIPEKEREASKKNPDAMAVRQAVEQLEKEGHKSTIKDPTAALEQLRTMDIGTVAKPGFAAEYGITLTAESMDGSPLNAGPSDQVIDFSAAKRPAGMFPDDSHALVSRTAKVTCTTTCLLVFEP